MEARTLSELSIYGRHGLMQAWAERVHDKRPRIATGWSDLDACLHRGGFAPGELVILGGRTRTRKTTVALNMMANMLRAGVKVGFFALEETVPKYTAKLASVLTGLSMGALEDGFDEPGVKARIEEETAPLAGLMVARGARPTFEAMDSFLEMSLVDQNEPLQVVFLDYSSLLARDKYAGAENQRVLRLLEELQVWTAKHDISVVALHQVGRTDEASSAKRYHGATPMTLESLMYGGEQVADIVLGTYRPALERVGNMSWDEAQAEGIDSETHEDAVNRVERYQDITFLQLLKNRPGDTVDHKGIMLRSPSKSMAMVPAALDGDEAEVVKLGAHRS